MQQANTLCGRACITFTRYASWLSMHIELHMFSHRSLRNCPQSIALSPPFFAGHSGGQHRQHRHSQIDRRQAAQEIHSGRTRATGHRSQVAARSFPGCRSAVRRRCELLKGARSPVRQVRQRQDKGGEFDSRRIDTEVKRCRQEAHDQQRAGVMRVL